MSRAGSASVGSFFSSRARLGLSPRMLNCQRRFWSFANCRTFAEFQRAILTLHPQLGVTFFDERLHVLFRLSDAQDFLDGRDARLHFGPAVNAQRSHAVVDG